MFEVYLEQRAQRDLKRLSAKDFHRITQSIRSLGDDPRPSGCRKITGSKSDWRIRVSDFRVIYEIDEKAKAVRVMMIRHRRDAYRRT